MTFTVEHAKQNRKIRPAAIDALKVVGWKPKPEPEDWRLRGMNAALYLVSAFPDVSTKRLHSHVLAQMARYRSAPSAWSPPAEGEEGE